MNKVPKQSRSVSLETYIQLVNSCAAGSLDRQIVNGSAFHARVLIAKLFEIAKKKVVIVTGHLVDAAPGNIDVYGHAPVIEQARKFLRDPGARLQIVVQDGQVDGQENNRFLKAIVGDPERNGLVELLVARPGVLNQENPHFMVTDESAFRLETGDDAKHSAVPVSAFANFGDPKTGKDLSGYFNELVDYLKTDDHRQSGHLFKPGEGFALA